MVIQKSSNYSLKKLKILRQNNAYKVLFPQFLQTYSVATTY